MMCMMGARNTRGFTSCVESGQIPPEDHITYEGVFNQLKFDVGPKTLKTVDCHIGYARYQFQQSLYDSKMNDYLCLFLKSQRDGTQRSDLPLNAVISLDVSGSMNGPLEDQKQQRRLELAIEAIKMFISKLRPSDSIGLVTFTTKQKVIFEPIFKKDLDQNIYDLLDQIKAGGGTTIQAGLSTPKQMLKKFIKQNKILKSENRIIMLTDVCDNSIQGTQKFVVQASKSDNIHLTIVGLSNQFQSKTCQKLKNAKGFNYFCAINNQDIKKHIFEQFDFNFFPAAHNISVKLITDNVQSFETFGAPDSANVLKYNKNFQQSKFSTFFALFGQKKNGKQYTVTETKTIFPSEIQIINNKVYTVGGVILIKLKKTQPSQQFKGELIINYRDINDQKREERFEINYNFPEKQQFYSEQCLREALEGYTFTSQIKNILRQLKNQSSDISEEKLKEKLEEYLKFFTTLQTITPQSKKKDVQGLKKIVKNRIQNRVKAKII